MLCRAEAARGVFRIPWGLQERWIREGGPSLGGWYILGYVPRGVLPMQGSLSKETRGCLGECSFLTIALSDILPWKRWVE